MYLNYYGLARPPFDPAPQPDDLFETPTHNEALASLVYGMLENKGFIALSGEVGVGKTTVLRRALAYAVSADPKLLVVELANPTLGPAALAASLHRALRLDFDASVDADLEPLRAELTHLAGEGWRLLLVIDEAQSLPAASLEFLRILSNLVGGGRPVIQVVLAGQPELDAILQDPAQRALRQRIAVRARIRPLTRREVAAYLDFKLSRAGAPPGGVLSRAAIRRIAASSAGFPRRVNIIADNALMAGFGADRKPVGRAIVARALAALDDRPRRRVWALAGRLAAPAAMVLAVVGAVVGWSAIPVPFGAGADPADRALASPPAASAPPVVASPVVASSEVVAAADVAPAPAAPAEFAPVEVASAETVPAAAPPMILQPAPRPIVYRVQPGDSLTMILRSHALAADAATLAQLRQINPALTDLDRVYAGQAILLPAATP